MNVTVDIPEDLRAEAEKISDIQTQFVAFLTEKVSQGVGATKQSVSEVFEQIDSIREGGFTLGDMSLKDAIAYGRR